MSNERPVRSASLITFHSFLTPFSLSLCFALLAAAPLFANSGFLSTRNLGESPFLLQRLHQLLAALSAGQFPARWMPDAAYGYGFPFFSYYASLPYYLAALFKLYGFSFVLSLKLTQLSALLVAAAGAYAWARALSRSPAQALLASAAYTFAPFHLVNLYARGDSLSELWAMAWYPLILWRAHRCQASLTFLNALALALCVGGLILTHNISALIFMPFVLLYLAFGSWRSYKNIRAWLASAMLPVLWGLALSAFFWLPALGETAAVQIGGANTGFFSYANHFRSGDLIQPTWFFNFDAIPGQPTPLSMGLMQALALSAGLGVVTWRVVRPRRFESGEGFILLGLVLSTWMMTPASAWVWEHVPLLAYAQFPWRFLSVQALFAALVIAQLGSAVSRPPSAVVSNSIVRLAPYVLPAVLAFFTLGQLRPDFIPLTDADVRAQRLWLYESFTANIGSTIGYEYLPRAVQPRPYISEAVLGRPSRLKVLSGSATGEQTGRRGVSEQWTIEVAGTGATLAVPTFYWPGWRAEADGQPLAVRAAESLGWITFDLPAGQHDVKLWLGRTPLRALAETISGLALVVPLGYALYSLRKGWWRRRLKNWKLRRWAWGLGLLILGWQVIHFRIYSAPVSLPLSLDFAQLAYPHHAAIRFSDGTRLTRVAYGTHFIRDQILMIRTTWDIAAPGTFQLTLVSPSDLSASVGGGISITSTAIAPEVVVSFVIPNDLPDGLYFVALTHSAGPALTSAGRNRGRVYLEPILIENGFFPGAYSEFGPLADFGSEIKLFVAQAETPKLERLQVELFWGATHTVSRNYVVALRLRDQAGNEWAALDSQPRGGYYPTALWSEGETVPDVYDLSLPPGTPPGDYALTVSLYDPLSLASIGEARITATLTTTTPSYLGDQPVHFLPAPDIGLDKIDFPDEVTQGDAPELAAHWITLAEPTHNYRAHWTLLAADGVSVTQTLDLAPGSTPRHWPAHAFVLGRVRLPVPLDLRPGDYRLYLQLLDEQEQPAGENILVKSLKVAGRSRVFEVPPLQTEVGATFGGVLTLWGYDVQRTENELALTLAWGALEAPGRDYKFFVHLFDPADESVPTQVDAVPRDFTYPTGLWGTGEVVTDTVTLNLREAPVGEYRVAVGWYDPAYPDDRLPAFNAQGQPLDFNRVVLPLLVEVP